VTKLGIYATYSLRSSMRFFARYSNFCKPLKTNSEGCLSNQVSAAVMTSASDEKWRPFNCFIQSREQVVVRRGCRRIGWLDKTLEAQIDQFLLGCKCPVSRSNVVQEQDLLGDLPSAFFLQNVLQLHHQRSVILRVDSLAVWKIINEKDAVLIPKKSRRELFQRFFAFGIFWGQCEPLCRHSIYCCFVSGS